MSLKVGRFLEVGPVRGEPFLAWDREITPVAWTVALRLSLPRLPVGGAFVWTRPVAVEVADWTGWHRIPIIDPALRLRLGLLVVVVLLSLVFGRRRRTVKPAADS